MQRSQATVSQGHSSDGARGDRRRKLVETAVRLFSDRPYDEVSVQEIAAEAGVATGLLYYHFTDKEGLYAAALVHVAEQMKERIDAAIDPSRPPLEQLMAALDAHLTFVEQHATGYRELLRGAGSQPKVSAILERQRGEHLQMMTDALPPEIPRSPLVKATLEGWLHFADGIQLAWLRSSDLDRGKMSELCGRVLFGAVIAAAEVERGKAASESGRPQADGSVPAAPAV